MLWAKGNSLEFCFKFGYPNLGVRRAYSMIVIMMILGFVPGECSLEQAHLLTFMYTGKMCWETIQIGFF